MLRVFHPAPWPAAGGAITLSTAESSHLVRVRRARVGESVEVLDGVGGVASATLAADNARAARLRLGQIILHPAPPPRVLAVGLPKGDLFTEIVRQATELGATAVQPLLTARTEVRLAADRAEHKLDRWRAAALEAGKQSGNPWLPEISAPVELAQWLKNLPAAKSESLRLVAALTPDARPLAQCLSASAPQRLLICIGPEGDFTPGEYAALQAASFQFVRLPGYVLRVETACVAALAALG
ncbi:MAG TPA: RsmE family RNA methyltransferase [Opitutales bacterium]|nr:RsmE family RNA methyltransferase [Opitutales bacterium]